VDIKKYSSVLTKSQLGELVRAIGLASHDVGIGSFVYLRRIFEALVEEAHDLAMKDPSWNEDDYGRSRMAEKIDLLKNYLPDFLVQNRQIYSLLSKGLHELSEEECLSHFKTVKIGIELILDERLEKRQKAEKIKAVSAAIQQATSAVITSKDSK
jgi:hypothetical protein